MSDDELMELEDDIKDLTPMAQQVLGEEIQQRGIGKAAANEPVRVFRSAGDGDGADSSGQATVEFPSPSAPASYDNRKQFEDGKGQIFTYKTLLSECDTYEQAMQLKELLRRNGIESWVERPRRSMYDLPLPSRIEVGADQLEQAERIAAQPMPQEIIAMFKEIEEDVDEYEPPKCPACGDNDPVLENAEPVNQWLCEVCGKQWSDPAPDTQEK